MSHPAGPRPVTRQVKEKRHKAAQERAVAYDSLSTKQKLARLDEQCVVHGGTAKKQRARLEAQLNDSHA